jgi:hypothetical protein
MPKGKKTETVDRQGYPVDLTRPIVTDKEGVHTELSTTEKLGDKYVNFPTVWNGKRYDPRKDEDYTEIIRNVDEEKTKGWRFPEFKTVDEAVTAAKDRSEYIGKLRAKEIREAEKRMWNEEAVTRNKEKVKNDRSN